MHDTLKDLWK